MKTVWLLDIKNECSLTFFWREYDKYLDVVVTLIWQETSGLQYHRLSWAHSHQSIFVEFWEWMSDSQGSLQSWKRKQQQKHAEENQGFLASYWGDRHLRLFLRCDQDSLPETVSGLLCLAFSTHPSFYSFIHSFIHQTGANWQKICALACHTTEFLRNLCHMTEDFKKLLIFSLKNLTKPHLLFFEIGIPASLWSTSIIYLKKRITGSHSNFKG